MTAAGVSSLQELGDDRDTNETALVSKVPEHISQPNYAIIHERLVRDASSCIVQNGFQVAVGVNLR
jgi:hypothetical protein